MVSVHRREQIDRIKQLMDGAEDGEAAVGVLLAAAAEIAVAGDIAFDTAREALQFYFQRLEDEWYRPDITGEKPI